MINLPRWIVGDRLFQFIPTGWVHTEQVAHEEVVALVLAKGLAHGVALAGEEDELKVLVGLDERIHYLHRRGGVYIVVHLAHDKHQRTAQQVSILHIAALLVLVTHGVAQPLLVPPDLVHAVVVASAS